VGCHESRTRTPHPIDAKQLAALRAPAATIEPVPGVPSSGIIDFPRDVQPVLDKHCVRCHNDEKLAGNVNLTGSRTPRTTHAYAQLVLREQTGITGVAYTDNHFGNRPPRSMGSAIAPLLDKLRGKHHGVKLSRREVSLLRAWVDSSAVFAGTYAKLAMPQPPIAEKGFEPVKEIVQRRCASCHVEGRRSRGWPNDDYWDALFDCENPSRSLFLRAPLSESAGGLGSCRKRPARSTDPADPPPSDPAPRVEVFASTDDADYRALLAYLNEALGKHARRPDYWQEGFVPAFFYTREMKRYGLLPRDWHTVRLPLDYFALEERYYRLFYAPALRD
jgi:hypothetical protein